MNFNPKVHANNPAITSETGVVQIGPAAAGRPLKTDLEVLPQVANVDRINGMLISATTADVFIRSTGMPAGSGVLISAGNSLFLPLIQWPAVDLQYECAAVLHIMLFTSERRPVQ